jgi:hypothetical protein
MAPAATPGGNAFFNTLILAASHTSNLAKEVAREQRSWFRRIRAKHPRGLANHSMAVAVGNWDVITDLTSTYYRRCSLKIAVPSHTRSVPKAFIPPSLPTARTVADHHPARCIDGEVWQRGHWLEVKCEPTASGSAFACTRVEPRTGTANASNFCQISI